MEALRWFNYLKPEGKALVNNHRIDSMTVLIGGAEYQESDIDAELSRLNAKVINATDKAEELGNSKIMNVILLGCLVKSMQLESIDWEKIISENVKPKFVELNIKAFHEGMEMVSK